MLTVHEGHVLAVPVSQPTCENGAPGEEQPLGKLARPKPAPSLFLKNCSVLEQVDKTAFCNQYSHSSVYLGGQIRASKQECFPLP